MPKNLMLEVLETQHLPGLRALRPVNDLELAPGRYQVRVARWGVGDPVIVGRSDGLSFGLKIGPKTVLASAGRIASARRVDFDISAEPQRMTLAAGERLNLAVALIQDRGKKPALLKTIFDKVLGQLPDTDAGALADLALRSGINAAFGAALASALFAKLAGAVINDLFGKHALIKVTKGSLEGVAGTARGGCLCFAQLPDYSQINVGYRPSYGRDFAIRADDKMLYETTRERSAYHESHSFPRWARSSETYVVVDFEWVG